MIVIRLAMTSFVVPAGLPAPALFPPFIILR
nr:MAG TPA: hypothetical protein [Caudoviricetes sp.]